MSRILLVEDDGSIIRNLTALLEQEGFVVAAAMTMQAALRCIEEEHFDLLLVDVSLPDGTGYAVCTAARQRNDTPVIFLTASGDEHSVVTGLSLGADDYIAKPFRPLELVSRIRTVLRRRERAGGTIEAGTLVIDTERGTVHKAGQEIFLTALEYKMLLIFVNHRGAVLSRERLLDDIFNMAGEYVGDNTLTVYIKRLREKIEDDPQNAQIIRTVRGVGYRMEG